jgi:nucleoid-associated protein YgaU
MALSRYRSDSTLTTKSGNSIKSSATAVDRIRRAQKNGELTVIIRRTKEGERLDRIAGELYGDGRLWWIIAAASKIGWWTQVPPGTRLIIPTNMAQIEGLV